MIKWYPDKSDSTTKWPYLMLRNQLDIAGKIAIKRAGSIEKELDLEDYSGNIDLPDSIDKNLQKTFDKIKLSLSISLISPEEENFLDVCQSENDVSILFNLNCDKTNMQINETVDFVSPVTHHEIEIPRNELYGELDLEVFGILNTDYDTDEDDVAYKKGSVIATSIPVRIIIDYEGGLFGGKLQEKFQHFDNYKKFHKENFHCLCPQMKQSNYSYCFVLYFQPSNPPKHGADASTKGKRFRSHISPVDI